MMSLFLPNLHCHPSQLSTDLNLQPLPWTPQPYSNSSAVSHQFAVSHPNLDAQTLRTEVLKPKPLRPNTLFSWLSMSPSSSPLSKPSLAFPHDKLNDGRQATTKDIAVPSSKTSTNFAGSFLATDMQYKTDSTHFSDYLKFRHEHLLSSLNADCLRFLQMALKQKNAFSNNDVNFGHNAKSCVPKHGLNSSKDSAIFKRSSDRAHLLSPAFPKKRLQAVAADHVESSEIYGDKNEIQSLNSSSPKSVSSEYNQQHSKRVGEKDILRFKRKTEDPIGLHQLVSKKQKYLNDIETPTSPAGPTCNYQESASTPGTHFDDAYLTSCCKETRPNMALNRQDMERKSFRCGQCRYVTDRKNNLKRHIVTMHQESGKVLECCSVIFQNKAALREHNSVFHRLGYRCQVCSRNFCRKALLRRHLTVHSGQKDFFCELCGYATSHKSNLERHHKVHAKRESIVLSSKYTKNDLSEEFHTHQMQEIASEIPAISRAFYSQGLQSLFNQDQSPILHQLPLSVKPCESTFTNTYESRREVDRHRIRRSVHHAKNRIGLHGMRRPENRHIAHALDEEDANSKASSPSTSQQDLNCCGDRVFTLSHIPATVSDELDTDRTEGYSPLSCDNASKKISKQGGTKDFLTVKECSEIRGKVSPEHTQDDTLSAKRRNEKLQKLTQKKLFNKHQTGMLPKSRMCPNLYRCPDCRVNFPAQNNFLSHVCSSQVDRSAFNVPLVTAVRTGRL